MMDGLMYVWGIILIAGLIVSLCEKSVAGLIGTSCCILTFLIVAWGMSHLQTQVDIKSGVKEYYLTAEGDRDVRYVPFVQDVIDRKELNEKRSDLEEKERDVNSLRQEVEARDMMQKLDKILEKFEFKREDLGPPILIPDQKLKDSIKS